MTIGWKKNSFHFKFLAIIAYPKVFCETEKITKYGNARARPFSPKASKHRGNGKLPEFGCKRQLM